MSLSAESPPSTITEYAYRSNQIRRGTPSNVDRLIAAFTEAIERDPNDAVALMRRGTALGYKWRTFVADENRDNTVRDRALEDLSRAIELDDTLTLAYFNRASVYFSRPQRLNLDELEMRKDDLEKTLDLLNKAIALNARDVDAYRLRATLAVRLYDEDSDESWKTSALEDWKAALDLEPDNAEIYAERGANYGYFGETDKAIKDLSAAIELDKFLIDAYNSRGVQHRKKGNYTEAIEDYSRAIELNPDFTWPYGNRGNVYVDLGDYDRAIKDFDAALAIKVYPAAYLAKSEAYTASRAIPMRLSLRLTQGSRNFQDTPRRAYI